jgi:superfamily I DNA/RNA helicase
MMDSTLLATLNDAQKEAVLHTEGPLLIQAGAGSGKTKTLTHRIAYILENDRAKPWEILSVTFTNKAAKEMRGRVAMLLGRSADDRAFMPYMGTFHSICVRILRREFEFAGLPKSFVIFDEQDRQATVKQALKSLRSDDKLFTPKMISGLISSAKNELITADDYAAYASSPAQEVAADVFPIYEKSLRDAGALDFDDLISRTVMMLKGNQEVRDRWRAQFKYIMIDEYQDTNAAQYQLVRLLTDSHNNLMVIGDDWQCLLPGTQISLPYKKALNVEVIKKGQSVTSAAGYSKTHDFEVLSTKKFAYNGEVMRIETKSGKLLACTPNHIMFARNRLEILLSNSSNQSSDISLDVTLFAENDANSQSPWSPSRMSVNTSNPKSIEQLSESGMSFRSGKNDGLRSEIHKLDYGDVERAVLAITNCSGGNEVSVNRSSFMTDEKFLFMPAGQLHAGMSLPVLKNGIIVEDEIVSVSTGEYSGPVYDLDVDKVHNYIANDIVVHNSIYSWRGADFKNILNFEKDFPEVKVINLEQNYRSTKSILDAAHAVITRNEMRSDKKLWTNGSEGLPVRIEQMSSESREAEYVAMQIRRAVQTGRQYKDHAVLYRTNAQSRNIEEALIRAGMPYKIVGGFRFYDRKEIKDLIAYIRYIFQPEDRTSFMRIINTPTRALGDKSVLNFLAYADSLDLLEVKRVEESKSESAKKASANKSGDALSLFESNAEAPMTDMSDLQENQPYVEIEPGSGRLWTALSLASGCKGLTPRAMQAITQFHNLIQTFRVLSAEGASVASLIEGLVRRLDYLNFLDDKTSIGEDKKDNVKELISVARNFNGSTLADFLEEIALVSDLDSLEDSNDTVTLMTLHAAKGLEYPVVYMVGMEEGIFPSTRSLYEQASMEEERRLCYVGMTRAMRELTLTYTTSRMLYGNVTMNLPSRFLSEVNPDYATDKVEGTTSEETTYHQPEYLNTITPGTKVRHPVFGVGSVVTIDEDIVKVDFGAKGVKSLNAGFAPLSLV